MENTTDKPLVIRLDTPETECKACGAVCEKAQGLPMREGVFLENDDPGEWGGFDACLGCYEAHTAGGVAALMRRLALLVIDGRDPHGIARETFTRWEPGIQWPSWP